MQHENALEKAWAAFVLARGGTDWVGVKDSFIHGYLAAKDERIAELQAEIERQNAAEVEPNAV